MKNKKRIPALTEAEEKITALIWDRGEMKSMDLVRICQEEMDWKKSTTYTLLRRIEEKGILKNDGGTVIPVVSRELFMASQSRQYVEQSFGGSLPRFLAAFSRLEKLSEEEVSEIQKMIDEYKGH